MKAPTPELIYLTAAVLCAVLGASHDLKSRRIPNVLTGPSIAFGLIVHLLLGGWVQLGYAAAATAIAGGVFLIFFLAGGMGAGDVKLMAAVAAIAGLSPLTDLLIATVIAGGIFALVFALLRGRLKQTALNVIALLLHHRREGLAPHPVLNVTNESALRLPYGVAIAAGAIFAFCTVAFKGVAL